MRMSVVCVTDSVNAVSFLDSIFVCFYNKYSNYPLDIDMQNTIKTLK